MDSVQTYFDTRLTKNSSRNRIWEHITNYLAPYWNLPPEASVLELGTGYGSWIRAVGNIKNVKNREAMDLHPDLPRIFRETGVTGVATHTGSCADLSRFGAERFDLVLASNLLEHLTLDDAFRCVEDVRRILKPGGMFCVIQPNFPLCVKKYFDDYTHRTIFSDTSLKDLLESRQFKVIRGWRKFLPFTMKDSSAAHLTFLVPIYLRSPVKPRAGQMCIIAQKKQTKNS